MRCNRKKVRRDGEPLCMDQILCSVYGKCWLSTKIWVFRIEDEIWVHFTPTAEASPETGHPPGHPGLLLLADAVK